MAGLAVECALKSAIARRTNRHDFPPKPKIVYSMYDHDLNKLLVAANLETALNAAVATKPALKANWLLVKDGRKPIPGNRSERAGYLSRRDGKKWGFEMATTALVDRDLDVGRRILKALAWADIKVNIAFWAHTPQIGEWQLFIVTPIVDSEGHRSAYERVLRILHEAGMDPELPWRRIFLRSPKDPVLKSLEDRTSYGGPVEIMESQNAPRGAPNSYYVTYAPHPGGTFRILNVPVGDRFVEDAYVYGATWHVSGLDHLREFLSKLRLNRDAVAAVEELSTEKRALIPNVQLRVRDFKQLRPA